MFAKLIIDENDQKIGEKVKNQDTNLLEFYGTECIYCRKMEPLVRKLEKEVKVKRIEVWHHSANAHMLQKIDQGFCGGVPFFYNTKTEGWICGQVPYDQLKEWALGK
jgi:thiol-disulfide isomerase/thioredoxin